MKILNGKSLAETLIHQLEIRAGLLKKQNIIPTLFVILIGNDSASQSYIRQKKRTGARVGIRTIIHQVSEDISDQALADIIAESNANPDYHGIIIQRPAPQHISTMTLLSIDPAKDIDGFDPKSAYTPPIARAIEHLLTQVIAPSGISRNQDPKHPHPFYASKSFAIIGKGETAGKPIYSHLRKLYPSNTIIQIDSKTNQPFQIIKKSDIVISCVGKPNIITNSMLKSGCILISVGICRDETNALRGDYDIETLDDIPSFATPTPGGVGPVNVACLLENLIQAATIQLHE